MPTVLEYLEALDDWRDTLANFLTEKGVEAAEDEKLNTLVPKVLEIAGGGSEVSDINPPKLSYLSTEIPTTKAIVASATVVE